jgi:hypothetical protein
MTKPLTGEKFNTMARHLIIELGNQLELGEFDLRGRVGTRLTQAKSTPH